MGTDARCVRYIAGRRRGQEQQAQCANKGEIVKQNYILDNN